MSTVLGLNIVLILNIRIFSNMAVFTSHETSWQFFLYMEGNVFICCCPLSASHSIWTVCYIKVRAYMPHNSTPINVHPKSAETNSLATGLCANSQLGKSLLPRVRIRSTGSVCCGCSPCPRSGIQLTETAELLLARHRQRIE